MDCKSCNKEDCPSKNQRPDERLEDFLERQELAKRMCKIKHKILVMSGKGGVGKSTVAVNMAVALSREGYNVGLLDVDIHGPSIPTMLNLKDVKMMQSDAGVLPVKVGPHLKVISIAFFLEHPEQAVIWRGPMKMGVIKQFLKDVDWGDLDYLIIDSPPGTGDEPLSVVQLIEDIDGGVMVTTPQEVAASDVRRSVTFCEKINLPVLGVVENMSGFRCPDCGKVTDIFSSGGGRKLAEDMKVPFLGKVPIDPAVVQAGDEGTPFVNAYGGTDTAREFNEIIQPIIDLETEKRT
ncbi:Mrp/NBP35 family ATP-binding protein [Lentisphaerota bacterium ZTH]|nr:Mrp/NBP35 family ATP-binding protein [Lentisphaerota bacterium]WET05763.1 Mrp/NBP35 family ATP-binding protein [Lentisphaerota bacterium ZTH]